VTDYGHDLQFGIFPTPDAAAADLVLSSTPWTATASSDRGQRPPATFRSRWSMPIAP
jgi:hypothetical protein